MNPQKATSITCILLLLVVYLQDVFGSTVYILEQEERPNQEERTPTFRMRRQSHPAATIARLHHPDNGVFTPIANPFGPSHNAQFHSQNPQALTDTIDLTHSSDTLIDYLVPPRPDSQLSSHSPLTSPDFPSNFPPLTSPFESSSASSNIQTSHHIFPTPPASLAQQQNQIHLPSITTGVQTSSPSNQIQSITFQNPTPSLTAPSTPGGLSQAVGPTTQSHFPFPSSRDIISSFRSEPIAQFEQTNQGRWDLGFEASDILSPPRQQDVSTSDKNQDYNTINLATFKRPNAAFNNPLQNTLTIDTSSNNHFSSIPPGRDSSNNFQNDQNGNFNGGNSNNIVWGGQKQATSVSPTTSAPFLPTITPNTNQNSHNTGFAPSPQNFGQNTFNTPAQFTNNAPPTLQSPPTLPFLSQNNNNNNNNNNFNNNNNQGGFGTDPSFGSQFQFDNIIPQGTVSENSFFPFNENFRHFLKRKRQTEEADEDQENLENAEDPENAEDEENVAAPAAEENEASPESHSRIKSSGPIYSFVKTDKNGHFKWSVRHPSRR